MRVSHMIRGNNTDVSLSRRPSANGAVQIQLLSWSESNSLAHDSTIMPALVQVRKHSYTVLWVTQASRHLSSASTPF